MSCPGCEVHAVVYGVTKKSQARPTDDPIPISAKRSAQLVLANSIEVVDEHSDRTIPLTSILDSRNDVGIA